MSEPDKMTKAMQDSYPPVEEGSVLENHTTIHDPIFGEITEEGPNYRSVGWLATVALMMKTQIGLGVLAIPAAFDAVGIIPGVIIMCIVAAITTWSDYEIGVFKRNHPTVYSIDDAGHLMFGWIGREVFGAAFCLFWIFSAGSALIGISIGLNSMSSHATCTAVFVAAAALVAFVLASIRTLSKISWLAWIGLFCILTSILIVTVAVGIQDRPASAPQDGPWASDYKLINSPTFSQAISACTSLVLAFGGTPAFFAIASEMRDPRLYTRSLLVCQGGVTAIYMAIGCVVYYYCGSYVASPALGSAGVFMKKICYGFALPGLLGTTVLIIHLPGKCIFVRILRGSRHLSSNSLIHWGTWLGCTFGCTMIAYIIASSIPSFGSLVALIGALFGVLLSFQPYGCMWFYDNWKKGERNLQWTLMALWCSFIIISGTFLMIGGTYGSIIEIIKAYEDSPKSGPWSCADNS